MPIVFKVYLCYNLYKGEIMKANKGLFSVLLAVKSLFIATIFPIFLITIVLGSSFILLTAYLFTPKPDLIDNTVEYNQIGEILAGDAVYLNDNFFEQYGFVMPQYAELNYDYDKIDADNFSGYMPGLYGYSFIAYKSDDSIRMIFTCNNQLDNYRDDLFDDAQEYLNYKYIVTNFHECYIYCEDYVVEIEYESWNIKIDNSEEIRQELDILNKGIMDNLYYYSIS